jgi:hypothetical protein
MDWRISRILFGICNIPILWKQPYGLALVGYGNTYDIPIQMVK